MKLEVLECREGHQFTRVPNKGRKPVWCEEHRPVLTPPAMTEDGLETLTCEEGQHPFTRVLKKGKKPLLCPDHKAQKLAVVQESAPVPMMESYPTDLMDSLKASVASAKERSFSDDELPPVVGIKSALSGAERGAVLVVTMSRLANRKRSIMVHSYTDLTTVRR